QFARELRREQSTIQVLVVIDRGGRDVDFGCPIGLIAGVGAWDLLESLFDLPPQSVEVLARVSVEAALEVDDAQAPANEREQRGGVLRREPRSKLLGLCVWHPDHCREPGRIDGWLLAEHREALIEKALRIVAQVVRQLRAIDAILVN